jgi:hypothetical protein
VPLSAPEVFVGLLALFAVCLPLGLVLLRVLEWAVATKFALSVPERIVASFFATGGLLFAIASVPLPLFSFVVVAGLLAVGGFGLLLVWWRERWASVREGVRWVGSWTGLALAAGTAALIALEVGATGTHPFPNANDGSFQSLYVQLLLQNHTLPWTYAPYASVGIIYPAGATVWLGLPALLFGWPISATPVTVPCFFLGFSIVGAYCWGERLGGFGTWRGRHTGLLLAGFFGLIGSWPRLFVGGSYDFAFALPLFLVLLGWLLPFARRAVPRWGVVAVLGLAMGIATSLSVAVGETLFLLVVGFVAVFGYRARASLGSWIARFAALLSIAVAFVVRSLVGIAVWYSYPGHVLSPVGDPPYAPQAVGPGPSATSPSGDLNPFVLFKPKVSPIAALSLELQLLLAAGLLLVVLWWALPNGALRRWIDRQVVMPLTATTVVVFLFTAFLSTSTPPPIGNSIVVQVTSEYENSYLLFICYQAIAFLPLLAVVGFLLERAARPVLAPHVGSGERLGRLPRDRRSIARPAAAVAVALLLASFGVGVVATAAEVPPYLQTHLTQLSNVSAADIAALEWAGTHLPSCSRVFAAPYSAAMFLNLYANVRLVFPAFPLSLNLSYYVAVTNLTGGAYNPATRQALIDLGITEVFVTAQTSVSFPALQTAPLESSPDFESMFSEGDASIFLFEPGANASGCHPT